jgi:hypothetical protein
LNACCCCCDPLFVGFNELCDAAPVESMNVYQQNSYSNSTDYFILPCNDDVLLPDIIGGKTKRC